MSLPVSSVFNDGYIAEQFEAYRRDPNAVDESWRQIFRLVESLGGGAAPDAAAPHAADLQEFARKVAGVARYTAAIRRYGHFAVQLDPLGTPPPGAVELTLEHYGITDADLDAVSGAAIDFPHLATARDVAERLKYRYTRNLACEFVHCGSEEERQWFRAVFTAEQLTRPLTAEEKRGLLRRLSQVDGFERFLGKAYVGYKRFSIEGTDALVPMLDTALDEAANAGARHVAIAMAHRGRLSVLTHILGKPFAQVFDEFEGRHDHLAGTSTGDVKYHLGFAGRKATARGTEIEVSLVPNPSHLEIVNPVLMGQARAEQRLAGHPLERDETTVVPIAIHGDAAFPGEGIVAETLNLSHLKGYSVGGTLHIIVNNQVGFTTDPTDSRSTRYASDLAKGFEIPIIHVNADDAEACVAAMRIAVAYRQQFKRDFLIDLVGYRRHGHNEGDEPTYTQPLQYERIKAHPTPRQVWGRRLIAEGVASQADVDAAEREVADALQAIHAAMPRVAAAAHDAHQSHAHESHAHESHAHDGLEDAPGLPPVVDTAVREETLLGINDQLLKYPADFAPHPRLAKQLERRRDAVGDAGGIDWGHAEALAFGSLIAGGTSVRITGQDAERGTFSHRHAVLSDVKTGRKYTPLQHLQGATATLEIHNSALSEMAVMGFEYGFSVVAPDTLTLWEGQFGDFVNVAQPMIDQFIAADRAKWGQDSGLVLLLPHGYEGQGPEHSSARLERFLQLCAENNLMVAYPSSPAQYFHLLRWQARRDHRRPLVLMQPKSLLRLPQAASRLADLATGAFQPVIDDPRGESKREQVRRIVFCTGKVYYDLAAREPAEHVAVVRVEALYPWPLDEVSRIVDRYPNIDEVAWVQEEPKNMGAWSYVAPRLRVAAGNALVIRYIGRPERASPAEGYPKAHADEQGRIVQDALEVPPPRGGTGVRRSAALAR
ncbi:MAG: 2-oxoglutarate dehydrogenase E1 component [Gemmatimonadota bacterium]|nr:2-oxoglutarate dehydrogenase E1 component [Gemmatimonadota bacterium]